MAGFFLSKDSLWDASIKSPSFKKYLIRVYCKSLKES